MQSQVFKMEEIFSMHSGVDDNTLTRLKSVNILPIEQSNLIDPLLEQLLDIDLSKSRRNKILIEVIVPLNILAKNNHRVIYLIANWNNYQISTNEFRRIFMVH